MEVHGRCMTVAPGAAAAKGTQSTHTPSPSGKPVPPPALADDKPGGGVALVESFESFESFESDVDYTWVGNEDGVAFSAPNSKLLPAIYLHVRSP